MVFIFIVCSLVYILHIELISLPLFNYRFLRQRYKYLLKHPLPRPQPKQEVAKPQKLKIKEPKIAKGRNYNRKESTLRPHTASKLNPKERVFNGGAVEDTLQKTSHVFDLNQNGRSLSKKDASFHSSAAPVLDSNHKDRVQSGKEAAKKSVTPFFDLNQISVININIILHAVFT